MRTCDNPRRDTDRRHHARIRGQHLTELTGRLVVATHELTDLPFRRAVVLVIAHEADDGAAGIVLNRPIGVPPPARLERWAPLLAEPSTLFRGGPVGDDTVIGVAAANGDGAGRWQQVGDGLGVVDLSGDAVLARTELRALRLFVGYAGWSAGQLEREIADGAWFVVDGGPDDALTATPDDLWRAVLTRQGGLFTTVPHDPSLN